MRGAPRKPGRRSSPREDYRAIFAIVAITMTAIPTTKKSATHPRQLRRFAPGSRNFPVAPWVVCTCTARNGRPQRGHAAAASDTGPWQSGQAKTAIASERTPPARRAKGGRAFRG